MAPPRDDMMRELVASAVGNVLEWFDFAVFGALADVIGDVFFPDSVSSKNKLLASFSIFGAAFIMRPIGGVMFGWFGDRHGRKLSLIWSVGLMAFATLLTGCLPPYSAAGAFAIVLLCLARLMQGLSCGGELVGSIVFLVEAAPAHRTGLYGSVAMWSAVIGTMLGSLVGFVVRESMNEEDLKSYGWRLPFLLGLPLGLLGVRLFAKLDDGEEFKEAKSAGKLAANPFKTALVLWWRQTLVVVAVAALWASTFYTIFIWSQHYMRELVEPPVPHPFVVSLVGLVVLCIIFPFAGKLSDSGRAVDVPFFNLRFSMRRVETMLVGGVGIAVLAVPLFWLLTLGSDFAALLSLTGFSGVLALWGAPMCTWMVENFPTELRFTAVAIGYNIAQAIFGGSVEVCATLLATATPLGPAYLLVAIAAMSVYVLARHGQTPDPSALRSSLTDEYAMELEDLESSALLSPDDEFEVSATDDDLSEGADDGDVFLSPSPRAHAAAPFSDGVFGGAPASDALGEDGRDGAAADSAVPIGGGAGGGQFPSEAPEGGTSTA